MSDKIKTLQDCQNELASENGHVNWDAWVREYNFFPHKYWREAAERYAAYCRKQGFEQGVDLVIDAFQENSRYSIEIELLQGVRAAAKESFKP